MYLSKLNEIHIFVILYVCVIIVYMLNKVAGGLVIVIILLASCQSKDKQQQQMSSKENKEIALLDQLNNQVENLLLSDVAYDIDIVPLETTEQNLFRKIFNLYISENNIFLNSGKSVFQFDRSGKYIRSISRLGQGPGEINYCQGIGIDELNRLIYLASGFSSENQIKVFTFDNVYVKTIQVANSGAWLSSNSVTGEDLNYTFYKGRHIIRRMLPSQDGEPGLWQLSIRNTDGEEIAVFTDPCNVNYQQEFMQKAYDLTNLDIRWGADCPILNRYKGQLNCLFDSNDTIYTLNEVDNILEPRYILSCGERPSFAEIRMLGKNMNFFKYLFVKEIIESKDYLYLVSEKDEYAYLSKVDKQSGHIESIKKKGEIKQSQMLNNAYLRRCMSPKFVNDLCGGLSFFPDYQNEDHWIMSYSAEDLLNEIDLEELRSSKVLLPEKRDQLVRVIENLKEDDNPVLIVAKLK